MAEYVRRRRPPPAHPYWERLRDRTHPPKRLGPILVTSTIGACIGLHGGARPELRLDAAFAQSITYSAFFAAFVFCFALPICLFSGARHLSNRDRWPVAVMLPIVLAALCFMAAFAFIAFVMVWYSITTGHGELAGAAIGAGVIGIPTAAIAFLRRRSWMKRQRAWPRWERMRYARRRSTLQVTPIVLPMTSEPESTSESGNDEFSAPSARTTGNG